MNFTTEQPGSRVVSSGKLFSLFSLSSLFMFGSQSGLSSATSCATTILFLQKRNAMPQHPSNPSAVFLRLQCQPVPFLHGAASSQVQVLGQAKSGPATPLLMPRTCGALEKRQLHQSPDKQAVLGNLSAYPVFAQQGRQCSPTDCCPAFCRRQKDCPHHTRATRYRAVVPTVEKSLMTESQLTVPGQLDIT